ncbi:rosmarinate synthase [Brachypodium distachyon]|uniref:Uncharacterized protein n=1 Tax=Brachypodium distachyon TaxID=15368 RepID=I1H121_BRADI|nr:rosmarinate synthase [Brachypodium distachyon]KQK19620.1 hypothetical protein BRADI_1g49350v3 [Brachypodium distachyon]|eukprot:XP_003561102.1 rosmarinate synthase [Brachypodium distachyon]
MPPAERLDVEITSRTLVRASDPPRGFPAVLPVSNLDLIFGSFHVFFISVYPAPTAGFPAVAAAARAALPAFLSRFFPFAGRIVPNASTGIPEIHCSNAGAELVIARAGAGTRLADVDFFDADRSLGRIQVPFQRGLALSLQLVGFACGGFALTWGSDHLLLDGRGLTALPNAWTELLRTGELPWPDPLSHLARASLFLPRSPCQYPLSMDAEFVRYDAPGSLPNPLLVATLVRRNYVVSNAAVDRLRAAASGSSRLEALSAHVWKLLATAVGTSDTHCRMAWLVDGRRVLDMGKYPGAATAYLGNVLTYASREAAVETISASPLGDVAAMAAAAIGEALRQERYEALVDWMEEHKGAFREEGGKWTEAVGLGTGSPALVVSAFVPFRVEGDFGFGKPRMVMPWIRPGRLGSAAMTLIRSPTGDGSWLVTARLWPRLAEVVDKDPEAVFRPATAERLGFAADTAQLQATNAMSSRM